MPRLAAYDQPLSPPAQTAQNPPCAIHGKTTYRVCALLQSTPQPHGPSLPKPIQIISMRGRCLSSGTGPLHSPESAASRPGCGPGRPRLLRMVRPFGNNGKKRAERTIRGGGSFSFLKRNARGTKAVSVFIEDGIPQGKREDLGSRRRLTRELLDAKNGEPFDQRILGSGEFVRELKKRRELVEKLPRSLEIKEIIARVCDHLRLDPEELRLNTKASRITNARSVICFLAGRVIGHNGVEVGKQVNLRRAGVSVAADRGRDTG